ncbi:MAG: glycosyltransferase [Deltaproteobacteria bacterium]|nr:glycosyltransferase [Deltaproteobacteria bacterium]MBW2696468.1 glycosyltransferase [Deltaproteobacteria bacterium]
MPRSKISVAMATCEGGRHLGEQLKSIAAQRRKPDELVICDDASGDDSVAIAEHFAERAPFLVRIETNANRLGATANFERAVSLCSGDVILLADQDDIWLSEKIEMLEGALGQDPTLGVVFSNGLVMNEQLSPLGYDLWQALFFDAGEQGRVRAGRGTEVFARHVVAAGTTLAFRARYRPLLLPFPDLPSTHDAWVAFMITAVSRCGLVDRPLIHYRLHADNQIGLRRFGLLDQYRQARRQLDDDAFGRAATFFELARERLEAPSNPEWQASSYVQSVIDAKIAHSRIRESMSDSTLRRLPDVVGEILRGRYWRYSYGVKSIAQDIFMR